MPLAAEQPVLAYPVAVVPGQTKLQVTTATGSRWLILFSSNIQYIRLKEELMTQRLTL